MALFYGKGEHLSALTTTPVDIVLNSENTTYYANSVSVYNKGASDICARVNETAAGLISTSATSILVPAGDSFTFNGCGFTPITRIALVATSGTNEVYIAAF
jgi:hypothetical protein